MGDSYVQVPTEGSGKRLRTRERLVSGTTVQEQYFRAAPDATYSAIGRLAAVNARASLAFAQSANADKQWLTLHHAASATKLVRVLYVGFILVDVSAATILDFDVRLITAAPATGNPAITPGPHNQANPATECTVLALPTTGGTMAATPSLALTEFDAGILAPPTAPPGQNVGRFDLYTNERVSDESQAIELRPGVLEGVAIVVRSTAAATVNGIPIIRYTEELP